MRDPDATRDISYAGSAGTPAGRAVIRLLENATGRGGLIRRADGYQDEIAQGRDFWQVMVARFGLRPEIVAGDLGQIPRTGPLILVANHPFGLLDGLMLGHILSQTRSDFRILAHRVFRRSEGLDRVILPVTFETTRAAFVDNIAMRADALAFLSQGGAIGIFPGGTVSTARSPFGRAADPVWRAFTARMVAKSGAVVVPVWFDGANSRLFQIASHLHLTLRLGLLIREFRARTDTKVQLAIGAPIPSWELTALHADPKSMMDFLRQRTYALSPASRGRVPLGYEFEAKYRI